MPLNNITETKFLTEALSFLPPSLSHFKSSASMPVERIESYLRRHLEGSRKNNESIKMGEDFSITRDPNLKYPHPPSLYRLNSEYIVSSSRFIISKENSILSDEECFSLSMPGSHFKSDIGHRDDSGKITVKFSIRPGAWIKSGIHLMHEYSQNYFHFITETLPRLILSEEFNISPEVPILIEKNLHSNLYNLLNYCNINRRPILQLDPRMLYQVEDLYFPSDVSHIWDVYENFPIKNASSYDLVRIKRAIDLCKDKLKVAASSKNRQKGKKIFISRSGTVRKLVNQQEIEETLIDQGFEIIYSDHLSLEAQVKLFSSADLVVGPTGASITNIVWCRPETKVLVLASEHDAHQLYMWEMLGNVSSAKVSILYGQRENTCTSIHAVVKDDFSIEISKLISEIE